VVCFAILLNVKKHVGITFARNREELRLTKTVILKNSTIIIIIIFIKSCHAWFECVDSDVARNFEMTALLTRGPAYGIYLSFTYD